MSLFLIVASVLLSHGFVFFRVRKAKTDGAKVIDVDGSYMYRKYYSFESDPESLPLPDVPPVIGWDVVDNPSSFPSERNHTWYVLKSCPFVGVELTTTV